MTTPTTAEPDDRDPFAEGREAHDTGQSETANPYTFGSDESAEWNEGYHAAAEDATND